MSEGKLGLAYAEAPAQKRTYDRITGNNDEPFSVHLWVETSAARPFSAYEDTES